MKDSWRPYQVLYTEPIIRTSYYKDLKGNYARNELELVALPTLKVGSKVRFKTDDRFNGKTGIVKAINTGDGRIIKVWNVAGFASGPYCFKIDEVEVLSSPETVVSKTNKPMRDSKGRFTKK